MKDLMQRKLLLGLSTMAALFTTFSQTASAQIVLPSKLIGVELRQISGPQTSVWYFVSCREYPEFDLQKEGVLGVAAEIEVPQRCNYLQVAWGSRAQSDDIIIRLTLTGDGKTLFRRLRNVGETRNDVFQLK